MGDFYDKERFISNIFYNLKHDQAAMRYVQIITYTDQNTGIATYRAGFRDFIEDDVYSFPSDTHYKSIAQALASVGRVLDEHWDEINERRVFLSTPIDQ